VKVGDLVRFTKSGYVGVILGFTTYDGVSILISGDVDFKNPTTMSKTMLARTAELIFE
jgi:hypothetical protein